MFFKKHQSQDKKIVQCGSLFWEETNEYATIDFEGMLDLIRNHDLELVGLDFIRSFAPNDKRSCMTFKLLGTSSDLDAFFKDCLGNEKLMKKRRDYC